jgi:hypothetical protein
MIVYRLPLLGRVVRDMRKLYYSGPSLLGTIAESGCPIRSLGLADKFVLACEGLFKARSSLTSSSCTLADSRIAPEQAVDAGKDMVYLLPEFEAMERGALFKNAHFGQSKVQ